MTVVDAKKLGKFVLVPTVAVLFNSVILQQAHAREVDRDTLCSKFPLNSQCKDYVSSSKSQADVPKVDLDTLCSKFPLNSRCKDYVSSSREEVTAAASQVPEIIKLKLDTSGPDNEWIRIERSENTVKLIHTTRAKAGFSGAVDGVIGAVSPIPIPFGINFHRWNDHTTTRIVFEPDNCNQISNIQVAQPDKLSCTITGKNTLSLPNGMEIREGRFTIEYTENELLRTITFRIPTKDSRVAKDRNNTTSQNRSAHLESSR